MAKKNIEMKIYEKLGVKQFRKMAFLLKDTLTKVLTFPLIFWMGKEERKKFLDECSHNKYSNYNFGEMKDLEDIRKFKKFLLLNTGVHIFELSLCVPGFLNILNKTASIPGSIITCSMIGINLYCIMLQRYNQIRINHTLEKMKPRSQKKQEELKEDLKKKDALISQKHTYKITDKKGNSINLTIDDLINSSSIDELKSYREYLNQCYNDQCKCSRYNISFLPNSSINIPKKRTLKIEVNNK